MAMDIAERAADALRAAGMEVAGARLDRLDGKDGLIVRLMPATEVVEYFDGSRRETLPLQVVSKRLDPLEAMAECESAIRALRSSDLSSEDGSYELVSAPEPDGDIEEVAVGVDMRHVWAARVAVQIIRF